MADLLKRRKARHAAQNERAKQETKEQARLEALSRAMQEKSTQNRVE